MPRGSSSQGEEVFSLWQIFFWAAIGVAAIVYGLLGWSLAALPAAARRRRHRARSPVPREHPAGDRLHGDPRGDRGRAVHPVGARRRPRLGGLGRPGRHAARRGVPWGWRFSFPDEGVVVLSHPSGEGIPGPELWLPLGETVRIELTSNDVIHAFWVPDFLYKRDAIPGRVNVFDVTPHDARHLPRRVLGVLRTEPRLHDVHRQGRVSRASSSAGWASESRRGRGIESRRRSHRARPGGLAHHHRPQEDRHPLLRHGVRLLPDRRHARRRDARPSSPRPAGSSWRRRPTTGCSRSTAS